MLTERDRLQQMFSALRQEVVSSSDETGGPPSPKRVLQAGGNARVGRLSRSYVSAMPALPSGTVDKFQVRKDQMQQLVAGAVEDPIWLVFFTRAKLLLSNKDARAVAFPAVTFRSSRNNRLEQVDILASVLAMLPHVTAHYRNVS